MLDTCIALSSGTRQRGIGIARMHVTRTGPAKMRSRLAGLTLALAGMAAAQGPQAQAALEGAYKIDANASDVQTLPVSVTLPAGAQTLRFRFGGTGQVLSSINFAKP